MRLLEKSGLDEEALYVGKTACRLLPNDFSLRLEYYLYLPRLYESQIEIERYRRRFEEGLEKCISECRPESRENAVRITHGLKSFVNFNLAYQGFDDLRLIRRYGEFVHRAMHAAYPNYTSLPLRENRRAPRIPRVGFVSAFFWRHTVGEHFLGWLTQRDRAAYEAHCYHLGGVRDVITEEYKRTSDSFFESQHLEQICDAIRLRGLDAVVFTDVGMHPLTSMIAALRLAPIQCAAFGHPVTTGLPTIDYFLSSDLSEPPDAQSYYTEALVRLPNLGIWYQQPVIPRLLLNKVRADFGLRAESVVYLCCQSLPKHLPGYDYLLGEIAQRVPNAEFVFVISNDLMSRRFLKRLDRSFAKMGLHAADCCRVLPNLTHFDYWNLNLISDIFLDPPGWSGARSTLDALACGLPIVTTPGPIMRQRQSHAILQRISRDGSVEDEEEYIQRAVSLATAPRGTSAPPRFSFEDSSVPRAVEAFFSATCSQI
jgi:predicted O-linked N-acetylglucosamine transferase (SPINDLY family)